MRSRMPFDLDGAASGAGAGVAAAAEDDDPLPPGEAAAPAAAASLADAPPPASYRSGHDIETSTKRCPRRSAASVYGDVCQCRAFIVTVDHHIGFLLLLAQPPPQPQSHPGVEERWRGRRVGSGDAAAACDRSSAAAVAALDSDNIALVTSPKNQTISVFGQHQNTIITGRQAEAPRLRQTHELKSHASSGTRRMQLYRYIHRSGYYQQSLTIDACVFNSRFINSCQTPSPAFVDSE